MFLRSVVERHRELGSQLYDPDESKESRGFEWIEWIERLSGLNARTTSQITKTSNDEDLLTALGVR